MNDPSLDRATSAIGELSSSVRSLTGEVVQSEALRGRKIKAIQHVLYVLVPGVILLLILAFSNFALLSRVNKAAADAKSTNQLLLGCFQPGTQCSESAKAQAAQRSNEGRQAIYVMLICLRLNPSAEDPNAVDVQKCVQQYYPNFVLPPKASPVPK